MIYKVYVILHESNVVKVVTNKEQAEFYLKNNTNCEMQESELSVLGSKPEKDREYYLHLFNKHSGNVTSMSKEENVAKSAIYQVLRKFNIKPKQGSDKQVIIEEFKKSLSINAVAKKFGISFVTVKAYTEDYRSSDDYKIKRMAKKGSKIRKNSIDYRSYESETGISH